MIQKKVCMVGVFGTGKTSLVYRYLHSRFTTKYHSTVGVKIDRKHVRVGETDVNLLLWDVEGRTAEQGGWWLPLVYRMTRKMMGDLTAWQPRRLARGSGGWYTVALAATPGSSQLMLRIDGGEWNPPPGLPTVRDEFGGTTGVVVIQ